MEKNKPLKEVVEVLATVGYNDDGTRRYKQIIYQVEHFTDAMWALLETTGWEELTVRLRKQGIPKIYGITFNFKDK